MNLSCFVFVFEQRKNGYRYLSFVRFHMAIKSAILTPLAQFNVVFDSPHRKQIISCSWHVDVKKEALWLYIKYLITILFVIAM